MDTSLILSLASIVVAVVIPVLTLLYTKKQVDILKQESNRKETVEKTSETLLQIIELVKKTPKTNSFRSLDTFKAEIITEMHYNPKMFGLILEITPEPFHLDVAYPNINFKKIDDLAKAFNTIQISSSEQLTSVLMECADFSNKVLLTAENAYFFKANPAIFQNKSINLYSLLDEITEYYRAYYLLKEYRTIISSCDNTVIELFKESIDHIVNLIYKSISEKHILKFESQDLPNNILKKLSSGLINLEAIAEARNSLIVLCDTKLASVQRKLFEMSLQ